MVELLTDPERCRVALVTLPEEMPVNEAVEAAYKLEDRVGVSLGPLIVNGCIPSSPVYAWIPRQRRPRRARGLRQTSLRP